MAACAIATGGSHDSRRTEALHLCGTQLQMVNRRLSPLAGGIMLLLLDVRFGAVSTTADRGAASFEKTVIFALPTQSLAVVARTCLGSDA